MTSVFTGFPEEDLASTTPTAFDNFVGGAPATLKCPESFSSISPGCPRCSNPTSFIMQLYCPVSENDRVLYFFSCSQVDCQVAGHCWRVLRLSTRPPNVQEPIKVSLSSQWELDDDDDGNASDVWCMQDICRDLPSKSIPEKPSETYIIDSLRGPLACRFIEVFEESDKDTSSQGLSEWVLDYRAEAEFVEEDENERNFERDGESSSPITSHFQLHLITRDPAYGLEPIRYAWCGRPIFTTAPPQNEWGRWLVCGRCGGQRVFEVQLFSSLNSYITLANSIATKDHPSSKTFDPVWPLYLSTLIVFSCKANCASEHWVEECVLVQTEQGNCVFSCGTA